MKTRWLFILAGIGVAIGIGSAVYYARRPAAQAPVFTPASNPYQDGVYANGILQSDQDNGVSTALYPEVAGVVQKILVQEGQQVHQGDPLIQLDGSVQQATTDQLQAQAQAARATLDELHAQPRPESLAVVTAQVDSAAATLKLDQDQYDKLHAIWQRDPTLISRDQLDNAENAMKVAAANLAVARRQYDLTHAGAWTYDVQAQTQTYTALDKAWHAAQAVLAKYTLRAPVDGTILSIAVSPGAYAASTGTYDPISASNVPLLVMGAGQGDQMLVRCYIDEILIQRLKLDAQTRARMSIRGTSVDIPMQYVRTQPYVSPKIQLSSERAERVDLRVLPVIFRLTRPANVQLYPGQMVDVYISAGR